MSSPRRCPVACTRHVADLASVFGLVLTATSLGLAVYTLWQARTVQEEAERLRSRFLLAQRAPGTVEELEEVARLINLQIKESPAGFSSVEG